MTQEQINKIIVEKGEGGCWHDYQPTFRWGIHPDEWSFNEAESKKHQPTTLYAGHFKGARYCTKCRKSIILEGANPDFSKWENFGRLLRIVESDTGLQMSWMRFLNSLHLVPTAIDQIPALVSAELATALEEMK